MNVADIESKIAEWRGKRMKEKIEEKYGYPLKLYIYPPFAIRMKTKDPVTGEARGWNIVAWYKDKKYEESISNRLLWALGLIYPVRWIHAKEYEKLPEVYEVVYQCEAKILKNGKLYEAPFVVSLFPDQLAYARNTIGVWNYRIISHPLHRLVIKKDHELYILDAREL